MAELKIKADSGGGTVSFKGPATTTSNAAVQLTLPVDDGAANTWLKSNGSGVTSWAAPTATEIATSSGTAGSGTFLRGDNTWAAAGGGLVKTVHNYKTDTWSSNVEDAWTDITGVTLTNTPASASNKHMGCFYLNFGRDLHHTIVGFRVTRSIDGGTATVVPNSVHGSASGGAANQQSQVHGLRAMYDANGQMAVALSLYDAPNTTDPCVYQVQFYSEQTHVLYLNLSSTDATVSGRGSMQAILQEVSV